MFPKSLRICGSCGAQSARKRSACEVCGASQLAARDVAPVASIGTFVRIVATFRCRACGQQSPLDGYDVDGTVDCRVCGMMQAYDLEVWSEAFALAHGLADLGLAPGEPGLANPFADAGETRSVYTFETTGVRTIDGVDRTASLTAQLALGHPLCDRCSSPLELQAEGDVLATRCPSCATIARYAVPTPAVRISPRPTAIVALDARIDGAPVRLDTDAGGAVAIRCPSCAANLSLGPNDSVVTCSYCQTVCRIPSRTLHALRPRELAPRPFFVAFRGPSALRRKAADQAIADHKARERERSIEKLPQAVPTPQQTMLRALFVAIVLGLVGLAYLPDVLTRLGLR